MNVQYVTFGGLKHWQSEPALPEQIASAQNRCNGCNRCVALLCLLDLFTLALVILITLFDLGAATLEFLQIGLFVALRALHFLSGKIGRLGTAACGANAHKNEAEKRSVLHKGVLALI
jgi:hypothetical protein